MLFFLYFLGQENVQVEEDVSLDCYGTSNLIQSEDDTTSERRNRKFTHVKYLQKELVDSVVWVRARLHTSRAKGNFFLHFFSVVNVFFIYLISCT